MFFHKPAVQIPTCHCLLSRVALIFNKPAVKPRANAHRPATVGRPPGTADSACSSCPHADGGTAPCAAPAAGTACTADAAGGTLLPLPSSSISCPGRPRQLAPACQAAGRLPGADRRPKARGGQDGMPAMPAGGWGSAEILKTAVARVKMQQHAARRLLPSTACCGGSGGEAAAAAVAQRAHLAQPMRPAGVPGRPCCASKVPRQCQRCGRRASCLPRPLPSAAEPAKGC